jgi:hypothetical protein
MSSNNTMVGDGHDCGNPCRITSWFDGRQRTACGCGYIVSDEPHEPDPFKRMRDEKAALETDLATLRRKLEEAEKERDAWRELYTAEVLLDDTDYTQPDHYAAVQRLVKATEALTPMRDGTLGRYLDQCREFTSKQVVDREAHWDYLKNALRVAGELAAYVNSQTPDCLDAFKTRERLLAAYRALTADGPPPTTVTLTAKLEGLTSEIRTIMAIAPDDRANPGCTCQRCRIIRALDGATGVEVIA